MMIRESILAYLKTIFLTLLTALVLVIALIINIQHQVYKESTIKTAQDETLDYQLIGILIQKNLYMEAQFPKDYKFNYRLGILYEIEGKAKNAETEYKKAIEKVPFGEYLPYYRFALYYLRRNQLDAAENLMDGIDDQPDKKLINIKADIFNKIGDKYYNLSDYETAGLKYQKALLYYNAIKSDKRRLVENNLASAYVYLADQKVNEMQIDDAITSLQMALSIVNAPILKYKLALLLMNKNPAQAYQYFEEVYKKAPGIINYGTYTAFLFTLENDAMSRGDITQAELYQYEIRTLTDYNRKNILSVEDLKLTSAEGKIETNTWAKKYNARVELKVKNVSKHNIDALFLEVLFKDQNRIIDDSVQQIADSKSVLKAKGESPLVMIRMQKSQDSSDMPKEIKAEIYALKSKDSYKILIGSINIKEKPKKKLKNEFVEAYKSILRKITAKIPAWLL